MIAWNIQKFDTLQSTQDALKGRFAQNSDVPHGAVIHTQSQTAGYGRHGRVWEYGNIKPNTETTSHPNLFTSFLIRPNCLIDNIGHIAVLSGLAVYNMCVQFGAPSHDMVLKWPNDVMIRHKKAAGILIDVLQTNGRSVDGLAIGVGVNLNCAPLASSIALRDVIDRDICPDEALNVFLSHFSQLYEDWQANGFDDIRTQWLSRTYPVGRSVKVDIANTRHSGTFESIDNHGHLVIVCDKSKVRKIIASGDVFVTP